MPPAIHSRAYLAWVLATAGQGEEAVAILEDLERRRSEQYLSSVLMALMYVGVDKTEEAISWLDDAIEERAGLLIFLGAWFPFVPSIASVRLR